MYQQRWGHGARRSSLAVVMAGLVLVASPLDHVSVNAAVTAARTALAVAGSDHQERPQHFSGDRIRDDGNVAKQLLAHYYGKSGRNAVIDWSFFAKDEHFMDFVRGLPVARGEHAYSAQAQRNGMDMVLALNNFAVARTSQHCYVVRDYYDFDPNSRFAGLQQDAARGAAKEFAVYASGCAF
ncbi:MAG: hypothetical protein ACTII7_07390 [Galactobacter sp.]